jgi:hypothetical protein
MSSTAVESSIELELHSRHHGHHDGETGEDRSVEFSLPPVDRGKSAWLFLAGAFMIEALVWGKCINICSSLLVESDPAGRIPVLFRCLPELLQQRPVV